MPINGYFNNCGSREQNPMCLRCTISITAQSSGAIYTSNEIVSGSGTLSCSPGSTVPVVATFTFRNAVVASITVEPGMETAFSVVGFDSIQIVTHGDVPVMGELYLMPVYNGL